VAREISGFRQIENRFVLLHDTIQSTVVRYARKTGIEIFLK
jgi:hypothetical protein